MEKDLNRRTHDLDERQAHLEKLQADLNKMEIQEKKIQDDLDKRTVEVASEKQELNDWRQNLAKKDAENRDLEKSLLELRLDLDTKLKLQQKELLELEREKTSLAVERSAINSRKQQIEEMTKLSKKAEVRQATREEKLAQLKQQLAQERHEIREMKAALGAREASVHFREEAVSRDLAELNELKNTIVDREKKGNLIAATLSQLERREHLLRESETEFYTKKAAKIVKKYKAEIRSLEKELKASCDSVEVYKKKNLDLKSDLDKLTKQLNSAKRQNKVMISREIAVKGLHEARTLLENMQASMTNKSEVEISKTSRSIDVIEVEL